MNHIKTCIEKYFKPGEVISWKKFVTHDGYDRYGPESNLYDLVVVSRRKKLLYYSIFHREYWFYGEDEEEFYPCKNKIYKNLTSSLEKENYYQMGKVAILKNLLSRKFPDLVVELILSFMIKNKINEKSLTLSRVSKNGYLKDILKIQDGYNNFVLYSKN